MTDITLKNFLAGKVTAAQITDYTEAKLIEQGKPAMSEEKGCLYRLADGSKCAIGHLISDEEIESCVTTDGQYPTSELYDISFLGGVDSLLTYNNEVFNPDNEPDDYDKRHFLGCLQSVHDSSAIESRNKANNHADFIIFFNKRMESFRKIHNDTLVSE